jgi:hypothetical protein
MNINRNNYEEYFLLYIDNELSVTEKNMVDAFLCANPDLQEELVMLQQSVVKPTEIDFAGKEALLKAEALDTETEEKLLLLLDDELKGKEKSAILALIKNNKAVKQEWEILQQIKFSPADNIIFNYKPTLYKKEEGKVIAIKWWRVAAAAMLIGFGLWGAVSYLNTNKQDNPVNETVGTKKINKAVDTNNNLPVKGINNQTQPATIANSESSKTAAVNPAAIANTSTAAGSEKITGNKPTSKKTDNNASIAVNESEKEKNELLLETINNTPGNEKVIVNVTPQTQANNIKTITEIPKEIQQNSIAIPASFKSNAGDNNTYAFEEEEDKPKRTKMGGFFKRVKRVIERKTKIKTGDDDEVRIANMSFAMH